MIRREGAWLPVSATLVVLLVALTSCGGSSAGTDHDAVGSDESVDLEVCTPPAEAGCSVAGGGRRVEVTGVVSEPISVKPPVGSPLYTIDRDAGVTARLRDGSVLWLFGDTAARDDAGAITYFVIGTASWAAADSPATTRDALDPAASMPTPVPFAEPTSEFPPCPQQNQRKGSWPSAAVVQQVGPRDRVLVWLENVCLGSDRSLEDRGMSVAEWWYDPSHPPIGQPIRGTVLAQRLFADRSYGSAALLRPDAGHGPTDEVIVYRCTTSTEGGPPSEYGPCRVASTTLSTAADPHTYREWDGRSFAVQVGDGVDLDLPGGGAAPVPPGGFSVHFEPLVDAYVMAYSPWPGPSDVMAIRLAPRPEGPWSTPLLLRLPGCDDRVGERELRCYAATVQPVFSQPGRLGIGWYDSRTSSFPVRGAYVVATVPVDVSRLRQS